MAIKTRHYALVLFFLIGLTSVLQAQTSGYFLDPNSIEPRFIQRLAWSGEYALRYEVIIERSSNGSYQSHLRQFTTALFIDVSLAPGEYRFRVIPYDILDRPGEGSRWTPLTVHPALQPELYNLAQDFVYNENDPVLILNIDGNNLVPGAEIFLHDREGKRFFPNEIDSDDVNNVRLFFDNTRLQSGEYDIVVRNPGGLEAGMGGIFINFPESISAPEPEREMIVDLIEPEQEQEPEPKEKKAFQKSFLVNYSMAWTPAFPVYGENSGDRAAAFSLNLGFLFPAASGFYIGPELTMALHTSEDITATIGGNLLLQKRLPNDITGFNFRFGVSNILSSGESDLDLNVGLTFFVNFLRFLHFEIGVDYVHSSDFHLYGNNYFGYLRPWLGIGFHF